MPLTKEQAKKLRTGDFIPGGEKVDITKLKFRKTTEDEVFQCCASTGFDPQSGPFYCGDIAEFIAFVEGGVVALCGRGKHKPPPGTIINK